MSSAKNQLQLLQHNLQNILVQKQQLESQLVEFNSALHELSSTEKAYKIVGRIMIASPKDELQKELTDQKETAEVRLSSMSKQEDLLKKKFEETQKEVMKELKKEKGN